MCLECETYCSAPNVRRFARVCVLSECVCNARTKARFVKALARYVILRVRWQTVCDAPVAMLFACAQSEVIFAKEALLCQICLVLTVYAV